MPIVPPTYHHQGVVTKLALGDAPALYAAPAAAPALCGQAAKQLMLRLDAASGDATRFAELFDFFAVPGGVQTLWELAAVVQGGGASGRPSRALPDADIEHKGARASLMQATCCTKEVRLRGQKEAWTGR